MFKPLLTTIPSLTGNFTLGCKITDIERISEDIFSAYCREAELKPLQDNYDRLAYVMYLLELPKHDSISVYRNKGFKGLFKYLISKKATSDYIMQENYDVLTELREFINSSEKEKGQESSENG